VSAVAGAVTIEAARSTRSGTKPGEPPDARLRGTPGEVSSMTALPLRLAATAAAAALVACGGDSATPSDPCALGSATSLATAGDLDLFGQVAYFANGDALPPGRYRVTYEDGCMKYASSQGWTIHAYANGSAGWWLVGATSSDKVVMPPGTVGWDPAAGAFTAFAECVTANRALPPLEFDFAGGKLGIWLQDSPYSDNVAGEGGRNPRWSLAKLGSCG
jgi:hypothetical protein